MQNNFNNLDDFEKYASKQDKWIRNNGWSNPELSIFLYRSVKFDKFMAGKLVEYILMTNHENLLENLTNHVSIKHVSVSHHKGKQSHQIWSGYVDSTDEYQEIMSAVNKFIEETKYNSGAI